MKFKSKMLLTVSMLLSTFGGFVSGMEDNETPREVWNLICKAEYPKGDVDAILFDKSSHKCFDLRTIYGHALPTIPKKEKKLWTFTFFNSESYNGGGSCARCNLRIINPKDSDDTALAYHFDNCNCKLCSGCTMAIKNLNDYKCKHNNKLKDSDKKNVDLLKAIYNYSKLLRQSVENLYDDTINQELNKALEVLVNVKSKLLESKGKTMNRRNIKRKMKKDVDLDMAHNMEVYIGGENIAKDILNSAMDLNSNKEEPCCVCYTGKDTPCVPSCGHAICLNCLYGCLEKNRKTCPMCNNSYYRFVVLKEKINGKSDEDFVKQNEEWLQKCIKGEGEEEEIQ